MKTNYNASQELLDQVRGAPLDFRKMDLGGNLSGIPPVPVERTVNEPFWRTKDPLRFTFCVGGDPVRNFELSMESIEPWLVFRSNVAFPSWSKRREHETILKGIQQSNSTEEVLLVLKDVGFSRQVESFHQHMLLHQEYEEESNCFYVNLESLKAAASFLVVYAPPYSDLETNSEGNVEMEWLLSSKQNSWDPDESFWEEGEGYMAVCFVSLKAIEFALLSGPWHKGKERLNVSGRLSHSKMNTIINMFAERMAESA